ncbi:MAG TPA: hypothetical protein VGG48_02950 [Rhizomicrobium sp.]|jgi:hypothetical protein
MKKKKPEGMLHKPADHPGLERDNRGRAIPMEKRLSEDRADAKRAAKKSKSKKSKSK